MTALFRVLHMIRSVEDEVSQPHALMAREAFGRNQELLGNDKAGFLAMGVLSLISWVSSIALLSFLTFRFIFWQRYYKRPLAENQYVVLIYNLLLIDVQQATAFLICLHWASEGYVYHPSAACVLQGWWIQIGDPGSGLFVLAIAFHTAGVVLRGRQLEFRHFVMCVCALWAFIILLGLIPVGMFTKDTFVISEAGWVSVFCLVIKNKDLYTDKQLFAVLVESKVRNGASLGSLPLDFHFRIRNRRALWIPLHLPSSSDEAGFGSASTAPGKPETSEPCCDLHGYLPVGVSCAVSSSGSWSYGLCPTRRS